MISKNIFISGVSNGLQCKIKRMSEMGGRSESVTKIYMYKALNVYRLSSLVESIGRKSSAENGHLLATENALLKYSTKRAHKRNKEKFLITLI